MSKPILIDSEKIHYVIPGHYSLEVALNEGDKWLYQLIDSKTINNFLNSSDRDDFYEKYIEGNRQFRRMKIFSGSPRQ